MVKGPLFFCTWLMTAFAVPAAKSVLSLGAILVVGCGSMSLFIGMCVSSWYGAVLFLVYVGGLLVMFGYVCALMPNNKFSSGNSSLKLVVCLVVILWGLFQYTVWGVSESGWQDSSSAESVQMSFGGSLSELGNSGAVVVLGTVLFLNLVGVVKVCGNLSGLEGGIRPHKER